MKPLMRRSNIYLNTKFQIHNPKQIYKTNIEHGSEPDSLGLPRGKRTNEEHDCSSLIVDSSQFAAESFKSETFWIFRFHT